MSRAVDLCTMATASPGLSDALPARAEGEGGPQLQELAAWFNPGAAAASRLGLRDEARAASVRRREHAARHRRERRAAGAPEADRTGRVQRPTYVGLERF